MAHHRHANRRSQTLTLHFGHYFDIVDSATIKKSLPTLWRYFGPDILSNSYLSLDFHCAYLKCVPPEAIQILGEYLCEIDSNSPVSAALSNGLEEIWWKSLSHYRDNVKRLALTFKSMAAIFDPKVLGCDEKIFKQMESFFPRHCAQIFQAPPKIWMLFLGGLDRMSLNMKSPIVMTNVLASAVQECRQNSRNWRALMGSLHLHKNSQRVLSSLIYQDQPISSHKHQQRLDRFPRRGDEVHRDHRIHIAIHEPHRITIDGNGPIFDDPYYNDDDVFGDGFTRSDGIPFIDQQLMDRRHLGLRYIPPKAMLGRP